MSLIADSCDPTHVLITKRLTFDSSWEEAVLPLGSLDSNGRDTTVADILTTAMFTSDGGYSWHDCPLPSIDSLSYTPLVASRHAVYAQTYRNGIVRTMDFGQSWKEIGGPSNGVSNARGVDWGFAATGMLCTINDNIVIAVDTNGNVWRTMNGGGDSIPSAMLDSNMLFASPSSLFVGDTSSPCKVATETVNIAGVCGHQNILGVTVVGHDSSNYLLQHTPATPTPSLDSIVVSLLADSDRDYHASLVLKLDDGTERTIILGGHGEPMPTAANGAYTFERTSLFSSDSGCTANAVDHIARHCGTANLVSATVAGPDSLHYSLIHAPGAPTPDLDSLVVTFSGDSGRAYAASLILKFDDGSTKTLTLGGFGGTTASLSTENIHNDTIGGTAYIPIIVNRTGNLGGGSLVLSYDPAGWAVYDGTYDKSGAKLDATITIPGSARINIPATDLAVPGDSIVGYALFTLYPTTDSCTTVTIGSPNFVFASPQCSQLQDSFAVATICAGTSCTSPILSSFLRNGRVPVLTVAPNPAMGNVSLYTTVDLGEVTVEVLGADGILHSSELVELLKTQPIQLNVHSLPSGAYFVQVSTAGYSRTLKVVKEE
jgi:hypothetical protein